MTGRRVRFVLSTGTFAVVLCAATMAIAQTGQGCGTHLGKNVQLPPGLPDGSFSVEFVSGGTVWQTPDGSRVTVPQTTFAPCSSSPTLPAPTTPTTPSTPPPTVSPPKPPTTTTPTTPPATPPTTTPPSQPGTTPPDASKQPRTTPEPRKLRA